ncbi:MAG: hypothetical protein MZW92_81805 [Comamonadaceae bacterium]|nr:hypothetical protein [Comamonadaceae bacterium]
MLGFFQEHRAEAASGGAEEHAGADGSGAARRARARDRRGGTGSGRDRAARSRRPRSRRRARADRGAQRWRSPKRRSPANPTPWASTGCAGRRRRVAGRAHQHGVHEHRGHPRPRSKRVVTATGMAHRNGPHRRHAGGSAESRHAAAESSSTAWASAWPLIAGVGGGADVRASACCAATDLVHDGA